MNAPDRIRAFLTARHHFYGDTAPRNVAVVQGRGGHDFALSEPDLEATLQTIEILTSVLSTYAMRNPPVIAISTPVLTTEEALDEARIGTVILDAAGQVWQKITYRWSTPGSAVAHLTDEIPLPAKVLS